MGKVTCLSVSWGRCFFYSSDHRPAHFHVENTSDDWEIRVKIETTTATFLDYDYSFPSGETKRIRAKFEQDLMVLVSTHREALMNEWEQKVSKGN